MGVGTPRHTCATRHCPWASLLTLHTAQMGDLFQALGLDAKPAEENVVFYAIYLDALLCADGRAPTSGAVPAQRRAFWSSVLGLISPGSRSRRPQASSRLASCSKACAASCWATCWATRTGTYGTRSPSR